MNTELDLKNLGEKKSELVDIVINFMAANPSAWEFDIKDYRAQTKIIDSLNGVVIEGILIYCGYFCSTINTNHGIERIFSLRDNLRLIATIKTLAKEIAKDKRNKKISGMINSVVSLFNNK